MKKLLAAILLFALPAMADFAVPELKNPVNDYANVLTVEGKERIATEIVKLKKTTGAQAGVLIVNTLDGESIEEASMKVARQWKLGTTDQDNGVVLLVAIQDRKMRLEVGQGLEGTLTDARSRQITNSMKSYLKSKDYDGAILTAITGVSTTIKAGAEVTTPATTESSGGSGAGLFFLVFAGLIGGGLALSAYRRSQDEKERKAREEAYRLSRKDPTPEQIALARQMHTQIKKEAKKNPSRNVGSKKSDDDGFVAGAIVGAAVSSSSRSSSDDSYKSSYTPSSSDSGSSWGGGGGDFSGGGSSDSW